MPLRTQIQIKNYEDELQSFPLTQNLLLESSEKLEDSLLKSKITLLREVSEYGLLNTSELYNFNIGYVKETFSTVDLDITTYEEDGKHFIKCDPIKPLSPSSLYALFIDKDLSFEYIELKKSVSKGPGLLELVDIKNSTLDFSLNSYTFKITSNPFITQSANIVKVSFYINDTLKKTYNIDAKSSSNIIDVEGLKIKVQDSAFGLGEEFTLVSEGVINPLPENYIVKIKTALTDQIKPLENVNPSQKISNEDILDYYKGLNDIKDLETKPALDFNDSAWISKEIRIEYAGYNKILLHLNTLSASQIDLEAISVLREGPAYNKYDLESLNLYSEKDIISVRAEELDDKTILLIVDEEEL